MINKIFLIGHVGRDSVADQSKNGKEYHKFSIATNHSYLKDQEWQNVATWHNVQAWGDKSYHKGEKLYIEGRQENRQYKDKDDVTKYFSVVVPEKIRRLEKRDSQPWDQTTSADQVKRIDDDGFTTVVSDAEVIEETTDKVPF